MTLSLNTNNVNVNLPKLKDNIYPNVKVVDKTLFKTIICKISNLTPQIQSDIDNYLNHYNHLLHKLFIDLYKKDFNLNQLKTYYIDNHQVNGRQYNALKIHIYFTPYIITEIRLHSLY